MARVQVSIDKKLYEKMKEVGKANRRRVTDQADLIIDIGLQKECKRLGLGYEPL